MTKEKRLAAVKAGLCSCCGKNTASDGFSTCEECRGKSRERRQRRKERLESQGLCTCCGKAPAAEGKRLCEACLEKGREKSRVDKEFARATGLCSSCHKNPRFGNYAQCEECLYKQAMRRAGLTEEKKKAYQITYQRAREIRREKRKAEGICVYCGKYPAAPGVTYCKYCKAKKRKDDANRHVPKLYEEGQCVKCGEPVYNGTKVCKKHYDQVMVAQKKALELWRTLSPEEKAERSPFYRMMKEENSLLFGNWKEKKRDKGT